MSLWLYAARSHERSEIKHGDDQGFSDLLRRQASTGNFRRKVLTLTNPLGDKRSAASCNLNSFVCKKPCMASSIILMTLINREPEEYRQTCSGLPSSK